MFAPVDGRVFGCAPLRDLRVPAFIGGRTNARATNPDGTSQPQPWDTTHWRLAPHPTRAFRQSPRDVLRHPLLTFPLSRNTLWTFLLGRPWVVRATSTRRHACLLDEWCQLAREAGCLSATEQACRTSSSTTWPPSSTPRRRPTRKFRSLTRLILRHGRFSHATLAEIRWGRCLQRSLS